MTYLDSSVVLSALLSEDQRPAAAFWSRDMASSRLTHYEVFVRLHARREDEKIFRTAEGLFRTFEWLELEPAVMARALDPFPKLLTSA